MRSSDLPHKLQDIKLYRVLLVIAAVTYLVWWFAVEYILPGAFNPLISRLVVVLFFFSIFILSYFFEWVREHVQVLFTAGAWLLTLHYFYLIYANDGEINWIVGSFITVMAINLCFLTNIAVISYSIFVLALSLALVLLLPAMSHSVFLPGLITLIIQANVGLRSRLTLIRNLKQSNERFQLLFNSTFEGIVVHENGKAIAANDSLLKMLGYKENDLLNQDAIVMIHPEERKLVTERMALSDTTPYETRAVKKDGMVINVEVRGKSFSDNDKTYRLATIQDITDRKRAEKEKVHSLILSENIRIRDEFISIASHELKTPISSLKLQTQLIERDLNKENPTFVTKEKIKEFSLLFDRQVNRLIELVETMLDVSRISSGRLIIDKKSFDLMSLLHEMSVTVHVHNLTLRPKVTVRGPESLQIFADQMRIRQVMENLLTNAFKYGEGKPVNVDVTVEQSNVVITVEDYGMGISPENQERIFNRFERAISAENISGLGLGLYITKQIIDAHDGKISVNSQLGQGAKFIVTLPLSNS